MQQFWQPRISVSRVAMGTWSDPYAVLNIPRDSSEAELKTAYRKALLGHHPDKVGIVPLKYSIDDINEAYRKARTNSEVSITEEIINYSEVVDLADCTETELSDGSIQWQKVCRCGDSKGYTLSEQDLELNGDADEIAVQCSGCSIWIVVQYSAE